MKLNMVRGLLTRMNKIEGSSIFVVIDVIDGAVY